MVSCNIQEDFRKDLKDSIEKVKIMKLTSSEFENNSMIPKKYTCDDRDINPPLKIQGIPPKTVSLALIMNDPDAPAGDWVHWLVWNMEPTTEKIKEGSFPDQGIVGFNSFNHQSYGGPCPPFGTHRYFFKLYALDSMLNLPEEAKKKDLMIAMQGRIIEQTELIGLYSRN